MSKLSPIQEFFRGSGVLLTGATGFIGKLVLEKILRSCSQVKTIYVLVRRKDNKDAKSRFAEIFNCPAFNPLREINPDFMEKIVVIEGDCALPNLGLSEETIQLITSEVNCIIHCAATTKLDEKLSVAAKINVRATRDLLRIAKNLDNLKSFVHISTAYCNGPKTDIDEIIYEAKYDGHKLITAVESLKEESVEDMKDVMLGDYANTYLLTKQIAEDMVRQEGSGLPVSIVRASTVVASAKEPIAGFVDSCRGLSGVFMGCQMGLLRSFKVNPILTADLIPVDYVVNCILAAAWFTGTRATVAEPKVFNCVTTENIKNYEYITYSFEKASREIGSVKSIWYPMFLQYPGYYTYIIMTFLLHTLPALLIDTVALLIGKGHLLLPAYSKIHQFLSKYNYFTMREWFFTTNNIKHLQKHMSLKDQDLFNFDITKHNWEQYLVDYAKGVRVYLMKDPMETLLEGRQRFNLLKYAHFATCVVLIAFVYYVLKIMLKTMFR